MTLPGRKAGDGEAARTAPDETEAARSAVRQALGALSTLIPAGVFAARADGSCWYVNQRLVGSLGLEPHPGEDRPLRLEIEGPGRARLRVLTAEETALEVKVMPLVRADGAVASYVGVVVDEDSPGGVAH
ncbi:MAG: hypothetical protein ACRDZT_04580, partial [Acidimicrobiales bacterium]